MKKKIKNISRAIPLAVALGVILIAAALAVTSALAQPPPVKIECSFYRLHFQLGREYSETKVAPKDIAWLRPGRDPTTDDGYGIQPGQDPRHQWGGDHGYVVLGTGIGHFTASTDRRKLCIELAKAASDHGANAINYQIRGTELRVQFLRIQDAILQRERGQLPVAN